MMKIKIKARAGIHAILLSTVIISIPAQEVRFVYHIENTGVDCPQPDFPTLAELPTIAPLTDPLHGQMVKAVQDNLRIGDADELK